MTYDELLAALCVWREARGEPYQVKLGVAAVIVNRLHDLDKRWPPLLHLIVLQKSQFSSFNFGDPNSSRFPLSVNAGDWNSFQDCQKAVDEALSGNDPTGGATFYHDISIETPASWAKYDHTRTIGRIRFFSG